MCIRDSIHTAAKPDCLGKSPDQTDADSLLPVPPARSKDIPQEFPSASWAYPFLLQWFDIFNISEGGGSGACQMDSLDCKPFYFLSLTIKAAYVILPKNGGKKHEYNNNATKQNKRYCLYRDVYKRQIYSLSQFRLCHNSIYSE